MALTGPNILNMADLLLEGGLSDRQKAVMMGYIKSDSVLGHIGLQTDNILSDSGRRITGFSDDAANMWVDQGEEPKFFKDQDEPWAETAALAGFKVGINEPAIRDRRSPGMSKVFNEQFGRQFIKHKFQLDDMFFNGYRTGASAARNNNPKGFTGVRARLARAAEFGINTNLKIDFGGRDMRLGFATSPDYAALFGVLDQVCWALQGGLEFEDLMICVPQRLATSIDYGWAATNTNVFNDVQDKLGRRVKRWQQAKWWKPGLRMPLKGQPQVDILAPTESANGSDIDTGATGLTSIFIMSTKAENMAMQQFHAMEPTKPERIPGDMAWVSLWWNAYMLKTPSPLCLAQIHNIRVA